MLRNSWFLLLIAVLMFALLVRLGFWQIHRGQIKAEMQGAQVRAQNQPAIGLASLTDPPAYQKLTAKGHFGSRQILLDNQHWQHRFGYHIISPFYSDDGRLLLVDRGWVQGDPLRRKFPEADVPSGKIIIAGQAWRPALRNWNIGPQSEQKNANVLIIEQANPDLAADFLQANPVPFLLRLDKASPYGFVREWVEQQFTPQRHYAYAVQWFAMALTLLILVGVLSRRKDNASK